MKKMMVSLIFMIGVAYANVQFCDNHFHKFNYYNPYLTFHMMMY
jgi:hypothetical protein